MEKKNRRKFIGSSAATVAATALGLPSALANAASGPDTHAASGPAAHAASRTDSASRPPVVHHVFFWLKNPASTEDRDALVAGLKTLGGIPLIKELYVGVLAKTEKRDVVDQSWQVSELMFFENLAGQRDYQQHQLHLEFIKNCSHLWEKVVVYDTMNLYTRIG